MKTRSKQSAEAATKKEERKWALQMITIMGSAN